VAKKIAHVGISGASPWAWTWFRGAGRGLEAERGTSSSHGDPSGCASQATHEEVGHQGRKNHPRLRLHWEGRETSEGHSYITLLNEAKKSGLIREFIIGEQWSKFELRTLTLIDRLPQLYKDHDLECYNRGITVVFL